MVRYIGGDEEWAAREFAKLWRFVRELSAARRVVTEFSVPAAPGDVTQGGIVRIGTMPQGDRGLEFKREDGTTAYRLSKAFTPTDPQSWSLHDRNGASLVSENTLGPGLSQPYLVLPFQPYAAASGTAVTCGPYGFERTHNTGTWTTLFIHDGKAQNLFLDFKFAAVCSDGTTAGEIQVIDLDTGFALPGFLASPWVGSIPAGTTSLTVFDPTADKVVSTIGSVGMGGYMRLGVQVRRTAGTGTITLAVPQAIGG